MKNALQHNMDILWEIVLSMIKYGHNAADEKKRIFLWIMRILTKISNSLQSNFIDNESTLVWNADPVFWR